MTVIRGHYIVLSQTNDRKAYMEEMAMDTD